MSAMILVASIAVLAIWVILQYSRPAADARKDRIPRSWAGMAWARYAFHGKGSVEETTNSEPTLPLTCSCPDFTSQRTEYRADDPRRLCRHLVKKLWEKDSLPAEFLEYREELVEENKGGLKGFYPYAHRENTLIRGKNLVIFADAYDENSSLYQITLFYDGKRYIYEPETGKWGGGKIPEHAEVIRYWVKDMLPRFQPRPLPESCIRTIYRDQGKTAYHLRGEITGHGETRRLRASMANESDTFLVFAGPVDSDFCSLEYHVMTGECVLAPRLRYMETAVKRWLEDEYPEPKADYLWGGF